MKRAKKLMIVCILTAIPGTIAHANENFIDSGGLESEGMLESSLEISGMLIDETVTKFGHELFEVFKKTWQSPPQGVNYNIVINELFDQFRGSMISVKLNDNLIYQGVMPPKTEVIEELGTVLAREIRALLLRNAKLEEEEYY